MKNKTWKDIWLIVLLLIFINCLIENAQSGEPNVPPGERIINFPADYSMGVLSVRDRGSAETEEWIVLGEARGQVTVPAGKELMLKVLSDYTGDFSPLAALGPADLQSLVLDNTRFGDADMIYLKGLISLRSLNISRKPISGGRHPLIGKPLGELKFTSLKGEQVDIFQYKGKVVLIDFWATWCGPCIGEMPNLKKTYNKFYNEGFEIIGISLDKNREQLENFIRENDILWHQHFDGRGWQNEIAVRFGIHSIPSTFLLDKQGIVRHVNLRGSALERTIADVLESPPLTYAQITDAGLVHLKDLTSLETLHLDYTQVGNAGLAHLKGLTLLKSLSLTGTNVTDAGLEHLKSLTALAKLNLTGTRVSKAGITELKQALPDCRISEPLARKSRGSEYPRCSWGEKIPLHKRILFAAIFIPIVSLLGAFFLKIVTRWTVKFNITYWNAYKIEIIASTIGFIIRVPFDIPGILWNLLLSLVVHLFVNSIIYGQMIKHPDTKESIGVGKGLLISLILLLISIALACVIGFSVFILMLGIRYI